MWELSGPFVPLAMPFTDDGSGVSEIRLARLLRRVIDLGVKGILLSSETGEFTACSYSERKHLLELVIRETHSLLPVVVNVSSMSTSASLDLAQHAARHGARGVVLRAPYFGKFESKEVEAHFRTVAHYCQAPVIGIDPEGTLENVASLQMAEMGRFALASPMPGRELTSDCFSLDEMKVLPDYHFSLEPSPELITIMKEHRGVRVVKGILSEVDLELGPVRQPYLALEHALIRDIVQQLYPPRAE